MASQHRNQRNGYTSEQQHQQVDSQIHLHDVASRPSHACMLHPARSLLLRNMCDCVCTMNSQWKNKTVYWLTAAVTATATAHNCNILFSSSFFESSFGGMLFVCDDKWFVRMYECVRVYSACSFCVSLFLIHFGLCLKKTATMWRQRRQHKHSHI